MSQFKNIFRAVCFLVIGVFVKTNNYGQAVNNTVTIRFPSNSSASVKALCKSLSYFTGSDTIVLEKATNGTWSKTISNVPAGFYYYQILLDGAPVYDRASFAYLGWETWLNAFEVNDTNTFSEQKSGPFGNISENYYKSTTLNKHRKCYVYTPSEYDANPGKRYPVIYLLQDFGENESAWIYQGKINNILDNAINSGLIEPMLIVMDNLNAYLNENSKDQNVIDSVISSDLVPYIDSVYHTNDSSKYRAIGGCSTGGKIAMEIALHYRDIFSSLGVFSLPKEFEANQVTVDSIKQADFTVFWLGAGIADDSYSNEFDFHQLLTNNNVEHNWDTHEGSYNWLVWRKNLNNMLIQLFK